MKVKFGGTKKEQDELARLVLMNEKVATSSLIEIQSENELTNIGDIWQICNGSNQFVCEVKVIDVIVRSFEQIDEIFAIQEGDGSLENWLNIHEAYYSFQLEKIGRKLSKKTRLECVYFERTNRVV